MIKRYLMYLLRWQLSTPILAVVISLLAHQNKWIATIIANLIGGLIFFWVDRYIFRTKQLSSLWEVREEVRCSDCGELCKGYRLVKAEGYDRSNDPDPKFRCRACSDKKTEILKGEGVQV